MVARPAIDNKNPQVKGLTFADAYGLGLLAEIRGQSDRLEIIEHLSPSAKKVAEIVAPSKAKKPVKRTRSAKKK